MDELIRRLNLARRAIRTLEEVLKHPKTDIVRDAAIQRFEYSYETGWKTAQCFLRECHGLETNSPTAAIRSSQATPRCWRLGSRRWRRPRRAPAWAESLRPAVPGRFPI